VSAWFDKLTMSGGKPRILSRSRRTRHCGAQFNPTLPRFKQKPEVILLNDFYRLNF